MTKFGLVQSGSLLYNTFIYCDSNPLFMTVLRQYLNLSLLTSLNIALNKIEVFFQSNQLNLTVTNFFVCLSCCYLNILCGKLCTNKLFSFSFFFSQSCFWAESPETEAAMDLGSSEVMESEVLYDCVICGQSGPSTEDRPTGLVVLLQASSGVKFGQTVPF